MPAQPIAPAPGTYRLGYLRELEQESIHILREVAAECERPVLLYSVGKNSSCLLRLCQKAFHPAKVPFPLSTSTPASSSRRCTSFATASHGRSAQT